MGPRLSCCLKANLNFMGYTSGENVRKASRFSVIQEKNFFGELLFPPEIMNEITVM
jgi:hypothetical protein